MHTHHPLSCPNSTAAFTSMPNPRPHPSCSHPRYTACTRAPIARLFVRCRAVFPLMLPAHAPLPDYLFGVRPSCSHVDDMQRAALHTAAAPLSPSLSFRTPNPGSCYLLACLTLSCRTSGHPPFPPHATNHLHFVHPATQHMPSHSSDRRQCWRALLAHLPSPFAHICHPRFTSVPTHGP